MIEVWTDGACIPNPGRGGWGWHCSRGREACGGEPQTTNNRMEMFAVLDALRSLPAGSAAVIYSDSQYVVNGLTIWRRGWMKKDWLRKGEPMPNRDLWLSLNEQQDRLPLVVFRWVRGHNGNAGNERADALADRGRAMP